MPGRIETLFSEADREAIRAATAAGERETSGELVVYLVERCDPHPEIAWKAASIGAALGALCAAATVWRFGGWGAPDNLWILFGLQLGVVGGWVTSRFDGVARRLIAKDALDSRVAGRAAEAFVEQEVFATNRRSGVLIFVALFEHRVQILADQGIDARIEDDAWVEICEGIADGLRRRAPAEALIEAVERCTELLVAHGAATTDDVNELSDEPRFRRE